MRPIFINWNGPAGRETLDEVNPADLGATWEGDAQAAQKEARRLCNEYAAAGMAAYTSPRPCANWKA